MENKLPLVSVIIPTYNYGRFIKMTIESLLCQTYPLNHMQIIVIDDGSTDDTKEILMQFKNRILYRYQENQGISAARDAGMSLAKGEIVTFLDADDIWKRERTEKVVKAFSAHPEAGIVYHPVSVIDAENVVQTENFYATYGYRQGVEGDITNEILRRNVFCGGSSFSFRRRVLEKVEPKHRDIRQAEDFFVAVIASCYAPAVYLPDILGAYRLHDSNITFHSGLGNRQQLARMNRQFAYTSKVVIDALQNLYADNPGGIDLGVIRRFQAKEMSFADILEGKRMKGIKGIPSLCQGISCLNDLLWSIKMSSLVLFVPAVLFPGLIRLSQHIMMLRDRYLHRSRKRALL